MLPALQSGYYDITWDRCADLPSPMYNTSAVLHDKKVYIMAGDAPDMDTYYQVYCYHVENDQWELLPPPGQYKSILQIIDGKLTVIGGRDNATKKFSNKVSTYINNGWTSYFPNLLRARSKPGVVSHSQYVIVAGGAKDESTFYDDIEVLNIIHPSQWMITTILLPVPMWAIYPSITDNMMYIVGYGTSKGRGCNRAYKLPVNVITSAHTQQATSDQPVQWMELPSAPHYETITIPNTSPPVIVGGHFQYVAISDFAMLDESSKSWKRISSLSSPRKYVAVVPITKDTILVLEVLLVEKVLQSVWHIPLLQ